MKNKDWCVYTYRHRRAFVYLIDKLIKDDKLKLAMHERARVHDMDKLLLYQFLDAKVSQDYHIRHKAHHYDSDMERSYLDKLEMVIDLESAPLTKPDKPMNAFDFVNMLSNKGIISAVLHADLIGIMHELGIDSSHEVLLDEAAIKAIGNKEDITEEMILLSLIEYCQNNDTPEMDYIRKTL